MADQSKSVGCLGAILNLLRGRSSASADETHGKPLPFRVRDDFLSAAEISFFGILQTVVSNEWVVCPKVNVADLLFVIRPNENMSFRNRIDRKHVDFVICAKSGMKPRIAVELDDSSHAKPKRQQRDNFLDEAFAAAGLPLVRFAARASYNTDEIRRTITAHLSQGAPMTEETAPDEGDAAPKCPKCGVPMVIRQSKRGPGAGDQFWGCKNFPKCREVKKIAGS